MEEDRKDVLENILSLLKKRRNVYDSITGKRI